MLRDLPTRRLFVSFLFSFFIAPCLGQALPASTGYKSLACFQQDTVAYLNYNWGLNARTANHNIALDVFFRQFELPIYAVSLKCVKMRGYKLASIKIYLLPVDQLEDSEKDRNISLRKYSLFMMFLFPLSPEVPDMRPQYEDLLSYIPELKKEGTIILPWKEAYKEILGSYKVCNIQYNYRVPGGSRP